MMRNNQGGFRRVLYWEIVLAGMLLISGSLVVYNNSVRSAPIFLSIVVLGLGLMLGLGLRRGGLAALVMIAIWFSVKEAIGVWHQAGFAFNFLEIAVGALTFVVAGFHHDRLSHLIQRLRESEHQLKQLDLEDVSVGLLKRSIGLLRLTEEQERAVRFRRPLSLMLVMMEPCEGTWEAGECTAAVRAVASNIKDTTRRADIPFLADSSLIGVILPETEIAGAREVVRHILQRLASARLITSTGDTRTIRERVEMRFGLASFLGITDGPISMLQAAETSLRKGQPASTAGMSRDWVPDCEVIGLPVEKTPLAAGTA